jgi:hypothetical protein
MNYNSTNGKYIADVKCKGNICSWKVNPADAYDNFFLANVTDGKFYCCENGKFSINASNSPPRINEISAHIGSPQSAGTNISFDVSASDRENDKMLYKFWLIGPGTGGQWVNVTDWIDTNHWSWNTTLRDVGDSKIKVWLIDNKHQKKNARDDNLVDSCKNISYTISNNKSVSTVSSRNDSENILTNATLNLTNAGNLINITL